MKIRRVEQRVAHWSHDSEVAGSNPAPAMGVECEPLSSAWMTFIVLTLTIVGWREDLVPGVPEIISITGLNDTLKRGV